MTDRRIEPLDRRIVLGFAMSVSMAAEVTEQQRVRGCVTVTHAHLRRPVVVSAVVADKTMAKSVIAEIRIRLESHGDQARIADLDEVAPSVIEWLTDKFRYGRSHLAAFVSGYANEVRAGRVPEVVN